MKSMRKSYLILVFLLTTHCALANAGSTMLWFSFLHLILINAFIGLAESKILNLLNIKNKIGWIIVANYISMLIGMYVIAPLFSHIMGYQDFFGNWTRYGSSNLNGFIIGMSFAFVSTLIIEYPFYYLAIGKDNKSKIIKGVGMANLITYFIMTIIYYLIIRGTGNF